MEICSNLKISPSQNVVYQEVSGETVLLDLESEQYFGLDPVGTRIWSLIQAQANVDTIVDRVHEEYEAEKDKIRSDVVALITRLENSGLVVVSS